MVIGCVIFDLDGTLVDSEELCNQAFLDLLPTLDEDIQTLTQRYRGLKLATILADLERRMQTTLPPDFERRYRHQVSKRFTSDLKPMPGVPSMLAKMTHRYCIASSGPLLKIQQALISSGLDRFFDSNLFSSYEINSWKPAPGLFLHAADKMGVHPENCVVIEDSQVGIEAGIAAGMRTLQYTPRCLAKEPLTEGRFSNMLELPSMLEGMLNVA